MDCRRFFCPVPLAPGARLNLPPAAAHHAARVLRLRAGDALTLFDGRGGEYTASIERVDRDTVSVAVSEWLDRECESPLALTLAQVLQAGEKMDVTVQKAVELGVTRIVPLSGRRSVVRLSGERADKRVAHWQSVAASAAEQCGRNRVPEVAPIQALDLWLAGLPAAETAGGLRLILAPGAATSLAGLPPAQAVTLLIGAEGGLDPQEIEMAGQRGFTGVRLGPRVLRTETAGMAAVAALQALWGDFREG